MFKNKDTLRKNYMCILEEFGKSPDSFYESETLARQSNRILALIEKKSRNRKWAKELLTILSETSAYGSEVYGHSLNVGMLSAYISALVGNDESEITTAFYCGLMHDIGKLEIAKETLFKPSELTEKERKTIQEHTILGYRKLQKCSYNNPSFEYHLRNVALQHHERQDGGGYPFGLCGKDIDYYSKIVAIADVYDALTTDRCYHPRYSSAQAIDIMMKESAGFDPDLFEIFIGNVKQTLISEENNEKNF